MPFLSDERSGVLLRDHRKRGRSFQGLSSVIKFLMNTKQGHPSVHWFNLREDLVIECDGATYSLREKQALPELLNMRGISGDEIKVGRQPASSISVLRQPASSVSQRPLSASSISVLHQHHPSASSVSQRPPSASSVNQRPPSASVLC